MALPVLISESDEEWAKKICDFLASKKYVADLANSGKECQLKAYQNKYQAVILDIDTKNHSGLEVLKYLRLNIPSIRIILCFENQARFDSFGPSPEQLRKLGIGDVLIRPYSLDGLLQSIEGMIQFEPWKEVPVSTEIDIGQEIEAFDDEFTHIRTEDLKSGNTTIFDCYLRLGEHKYVKILHKGDFFEESQFTKYAKGQEVVRLYFKTAERLAYINFINRLLTKVLESKDTPIEKKVRMTKNLAEKYIEEVYTTGVKPQIIEEGKKLCNNMYNLVQSNKDLNKLMDSYKDYDPPSFSHLFLVSFFASVTCMQLQWSSQRTVETIALAALLHDIGKLKLSVDIRNYNPENLLGEDRDLYEQHPQFGAEMLQQHSTIPRAVVQIVHQHHEYVNGEGFPNGLSGIKIFPPAKAVAMADEFAHLIVKSRVTPVKGINEFLSDREKIARFDPLFVKALVESIA